MIALAKSRVAKFSKTLDYNSWLDLFQSVEDQILVGWSEPDLDDKKLFSVMQTAEKKIGEDFEKHLSASEGQTPPDHPTGVSQRKQCKLHSTKQIKN